MTKREQRRIVVDRLLEGARREMQKAGDTLGMGTVPADVLGGLRASLARLVDTFEDEKLEALATADAEIVIEVARDIAKRSCAEMLPS